MKYLKLAEARELYSKGGNVTEYLRNLHEVDHNTPEIIEIAYDLQAGSYIDFAESHPSRGRAYASEIVSCLETQLDGQKSLLDVGTGELTTLTGVLNEIKSEITEVFAFDGSWSRVSKGIEYYKKRVVSDSFKILPFVADIHSMPLPSKSIDVVTSSHALEPNGNQLECCLAEIFRVAKSKVVLFEPCYESASDEGKARMDRLGYVKDIAGAASRLGARCEAVHQIKNISNPLNPTACFIIEPPDISVVQARGNCWFTVPGSDHPLRQDSGFLVSDDTGLVFPVLNNIPVLKSQHSILASAFF